MSGNNHTIPYSFIRPEEVLSSAAPFHAIRGDAGFDLTVSRDLLIAPDSFAAVPTNLAIAVPDGMWALLVGRSSTFYRRGLLVNSGVIDAGYRGEVMALVYNLGKKNVLVRSGERLFQLILITANGDRYSWAATDTLPAGARGAAGFGSTGALGGGE